MRFALVVSVFLAGCFLSSVRADTFGSGANAFDIEFVTIGNPGNAADTTGNPNPAGSVAYSYRIGKYEISEQMIDKANALGGLGLTKDSRGPDKPATSLSWFEAAKFVNWLNSSTGNTPAYKFDGTGNFQLWEPGDAGYDANNLYRNSLAKYFLPSVDEWYKAAYYDPTAEVYYDYPTGSDTVPDGIDFNGDPDFEVVIGEGGVYRSPPNDITNVGVLSPYGTAGQGGNVQEWHETQVGLVNESIWPNRIVRGGFWQLPLYDEASATFLGSARVVDEWSNLGFRVASTIPEPDTALLAGLVTFGLLARHHRSRT